MSDHPRSRGVYEPALSGATGRAGSSPLARGLPEGQAFLGKALGIIPARAGFTDFFGGPEHHRQDHPRSRGVYKVIVGSLHLIQGSSPLARGLLNESGELVLARRIIPARAGFTITARIPERLSADHPRSRGVYFQPSYLPE